MNYIDIAKDMIKRHESLKLKMYKCSEGKNTIGYGHNLDDKPISKLAAQVIFEDDMIDYIKKSESYSWFSCLSDNRKAVIIDMVYNMGSIDKWINFQKYLISKEYDKAANEMVNSKWFNQVGIRSKELVSMMISG